MAKGKRRKKAKQSRNKLRKARYEAMAKQGGDQGNSNYARKVAWCLANGADAVKVPEPKPWKRGSR